MRLFIAIPLGAAVETELKRLTARLRPAAPDLRWSHPEAWHITLQFLGNANEEQYACLLPRLSELKAAPFSIDFEGLGVFERAGVFLVGVTPTPALVFTLRAEKRGFRMQMIAGLVAPAGKTLAQDVTLTPADGNARMEFGGIGATLQQTRDGVAFASVFPGDPADQAGLRAGDVVVSVDGEPTDSMSVADVLQRLRGEAGTPVSVSVQRVGAGGPSEPREKYDTVVMRATVVR